MTRFAFAAPAVLLASTAQADTRGAIPFAAEIGGKPFPCTETFAGLGSPAAEVQAVDFRLFVSGAALVKADGGLSPIALDQDSQRQLDGLALLDFEHGTLPCARPDRAHRAAAGCGAVPHAQYAQCRGHGALHA